MKAALKEKAHGLIQEESLDTTARVVEIEPSQMEMFERPKQKLVNKFITRLRRAKDAGIQWPEDIPLVLVCEDRTTGRIWLKDGHHRVAAASWIGLRSIPALAVDCRAIDLLMRSEMYGGAQMTIWGVQELLADLDPLMKENWRLSLLGEKHKSKQRLA